MMDYVDQMPFPEVLGQSKVGWVKFPDGEVVEQVEVANGNNQ